MDERAALCARIGAAVRARRRARGLSQEALAEKSDISTHFIGLVERGLELPSLTTLLQLARVLDSDVENLIRETPREDEPWEREAIAAMRKVPASLRVAVMAMIRALDTEVPTERRPAKRAPSSRRKSKAS